jgi:hypothetical protein
MKNLRSIESDLEIIKLMLPPEPSPPACQACGSQDCSERGHENEGCLFCDACWEETCPAGVDAFLADLPQDGRGNYVCGGPKK